MALVERFVIVFESFRAVARILVDGTDFLKNVASRAILERPDRKCLVQSIQSSLALAEMVVGNTRPIEAQRLDNRLMLYVKIGQHLVETPQCFRVLPMREVKLSQFPQSPHL